MKRLALLLGLACLSGAHAQNFCGDPQDTFEAYEVRASDRQNNPSEFYVLSYTWAPNHCADVKKSQKRPGAKEYLQCGSEHDFGYILHGLWPQGTLAQPSKYPRACEGDQPKIPRTVLNKYLCMTPSVWLLQHEYENHGTCMPAQFRTPEGYLEKALELHARMRLPDEQITSVSEGKEWLVANNPGLTRNAIYFAANTREWRICLGQDFNFMPCPGQDDDSSTGGDEISTGDCPVKGNISGSHKKYYFLPTHPNYRSVRIDLGEGERCFQTEKQARAAGWRKAP